MNRLRPKASRSSRSHPFHAARAGRSDRRPRRQCSIPVHPSGDDQVLIDWAPSVEQKIRSVTAVRDVNSDLQNRGLQAGLVIDRDTASRLGLTPQMIDNALNDAFGQRQVSTMYKGINQYHVVMEVAPDFLHQAQTRSTISTSAPPPERPIPLSAFTHYKPVATSLAVAHQGQFPAVTFSFNLAPNVPLGDAVGAG